MQSRQELRSPVRKLVRKFDNFVLISSYEFVRNDLAFFSEFHWNYLILDEGHSIRNAKAKTTLAVKTLRANHRLILSGTPIQNSVLELWSLFDFLMPGFIFNFFYKITILLRVLIIICIYICSVCGIRSSTNKFSKNLKNNAPSKVYQ
jgi:SNF2 family DNA or RNA helicase